MSTEYDDTSGEDSESVDLGDDTGESSGTEDTTAGSADGNADQPAFTPPAAKTFTQAELDNILKTRLAEDRRRRGATQGRQAAPAAASSTRETPRFDPATEQALQDYLNPLLAPLREQQVQLDIDRAVTAASAKWPDFADNRDAIIDLVLSWGQEVVNRAPMNWLLEQGYLAHKYSSFDEKAFSEKTIADYVKGKSRQASTTPSPQGSGGRASTTSKKPSKPGDWASADATMRQLIDENASASS